MRRGLAESRAAASRLIAAARVTVDGAPAAKAATLVSPGAAVALTAEPARYVSRGGEKLAGALERFAVGVRGRRCLDVGASTGGFTDALLQAGAASVVAVDVGYGQLAWSLRADPRVTVLERTNARHLRLEDLPGPPPELVVADLSFISLRLVLPALRAVAGVDADLVLLVKPQFEVGRAQVGAGGVVRDPAAWLRALADVVDAGAGLDLGLVDAMASPLRGPAGNVEFFVWLAEAGAREPSAIDAALRSAVGEAEAAQGR